MKLGHLSKFLAQHFPKSNFIGVDITESAIKKANEQKTQKNVQNVELVCMDAKQLRSEWTDKFDLVLIFDACHDQCRPDLVRVREKIRVQSKKSFLKNEGLNFTIIFDRKITRINF